MAGRVPLMLNVLYFSIIEVLCGFSPNYTFFSCVMRALFGIGMGGEWGVGASLAMEAAPVRWRGILSGILQAGYSSGICWPLWPAVFCCRPSAGARCSGPARRPRFSRSTFERKCRSRGWRQHRAASTGEVLRVVAREWKRFAYLVALMTFMDVSLPRHAGFVSGLFAGSAQAFRDNARQRGHHLQLRSGCRAIISAISRKWLDGAKACWPLWAWCFCDPAVAFGHTLSAHHFFRFPDAGRSARRLGRNPVHLNELSGMPRAA